MLTDIERTSNEQETNMKQIRNEPDDKGTKSKLIWNELENNATLTTNIEQMPNVIQTDAERTKR